MGRSLRILGLEHAEALVGDAAALAACPGLVEVTLLLPSPTATTCPPGQTRSGRTHTQRVPQVNLFECPRVSGDVCAALAACPNLARASVVATRCTGDLAALAGLTRLQVSPG